MPSTLTEDEKMRARYHLGYPLTTYGNEQAAAGIQFGIGRPSQTNFLLEQALQMLLTNVDALAKVREILCILDRIDSQLVCAAGQLGVAKVGSIEMRGAEPGRTHPDLLEREYRRWAGRLADVLGVPYYKFSERFNKSSNFRVS